MPMEDDATLVAAQPQGQTGHRVRMMDVDDVVFPLVFPQPGDHLGSDHRGGFFHPGLAADDAAMLVQVDDFVLLELRAEHVTVDPAGGQAAREIPHDFFHATPDGVELTELEYLHRSTTAKIQFPSPAQKGLLAYWV